MILSIVAVSIIAALVIRYLFSNKEVLAIVSPLEVYQGEPVSYADSTYRAKEWLWEFGNGDVSDKKSGSYVYPKIGSYQIRLTVNKSLRKEFIVNVREPVKFERDSLIKIDAPTDAMQGQHIIFRGIGNAKEWKWSFGETGIVDYRDQVAMYAYSEPGIYDIELMTETIKYPIRHTITILPLYEEDDDSARSMMGNDIREKLQAIVDGKPFNPNYNHILKKYLCNNPNIIITINEDKKNDFYSYCQGLKIIGKYNTIIQEVIVYPDENRPNCLKKFDVKQTSKRDY